MKEVLKKYAKRYFIDAMGAMALGLFASLLIGTIFKALGMIPKLGFLADIGGYAQAMAGPAMAAAIAYSLKGHPLVIFSAAAVGQAANALGEMKVYGDTMTLKVQRKALGIPERGAFRFEFKFVDSTDPCRDPLDWYDHGVVEPLGRVPFVYRGDGADRQGASSNLPKST